MDRSNVRWINDELQKTKLEADEAYKDQGAAHQRSWWAESGKSSRSLAA